MLASYISEFLFHLALYLLISVLISNSCKSEKTLQFQRSSKGHVYLIPAHLSNLQIKFDKVNRFLTYLIERHVYGNSS